MQKFVENMLFGLSFGLGFSVAAAVLHFVAALISKA